MTKCSIKAIELGFPTFNRFPFFAIRASGKLPLFRVRLFHAKTSDAKSVGVCEILKQFADRLKVFVMPSKFGMQHLFSRFVKWLGIRSETVVTESEAKFFLDRKCEKLYHARKFFNGLPVSAKIHLQRTGEFVNCRSHVWARAGISSMVHEGTLVGKAESRSGNPIDTDDYQNGASGTRQWGVLVPGKYGRKRISYVSKNEERGWKGGWSYCLIR